MAGEAPPLRCHPLSTRPIAPVPCSTVEPDVVQSMTLVERFAGCCGWIEGGTGGSARTSIQMGRADYFCKHSGTPRD